MAVGAISLVSFELHTGHARADLWRMLRKASLRGSRCLALAG